MGRVVTFEGPRAVGVREYADPALGPREIRLRTLYSGISAGTEMTAYRGSSPYLTKRWEPDRRLFLEGEVSLDYPVEGWGSVERLERTVMALAADGRISLEPLATHVFEADEADRAFRLLDQRPASGEVVQAVLKF